MDRPGQYEWCARACSRSSTMRQLFLTSITTTLLVLPAGPAMLAHTGPQLATQPPSDAVWTGAGGVILQSFDVDEFVRDAPYSADGTTHIVQPLVDGNRIVRETNASIARDSRGRVRREQTLAAVGAVIVAGDEHTVTISDPASGTSYLLDPQQRIAIRHRALQRRPATGVEQNNGPIFRTFREQGSDPFPAKPPLGAPATKTESLGRKTIEGV